MVRKQCFYKKDIFLEQNVSHIWRLRWAYKGSPLPYILNRPVWYWPRMREAPNKIVCWTSNQTQKTLMFFLYKVNNLFVFCRSVCPRFSCENNVRNHFEGVRGDYPLHIVNDSHFSLFSYIYSHTQLFDSPVGGFPPLREGRGSEKHWEMRKVVNLRWLSIIASTNRYSHDEKHMRISSFFRFNENLDQEIN